MDSLRQKLKMPQTCDRPFYKNNIKVVLWKKPFEKTPNTREMRKVFKFADLAKAIAHANVYSLYKMVSLSQKLKIPKTFEKPFYTSIKNRSVENAAQKNTKYSRNETSLKIGQFWKGYSP